MKKGQEMMEYQDVVIDIKQIIVSGQQYAYQDVYKRQTQMRPLI